MVKPFEEKLAALNALRDDPRSEHSIEELGKVLASGNNLLVAKAAKIVGENEIDRLSESLEGAFARFLKGSARTDKGCIAKTAIAETLYTIGHDQEEVFLQGIAHKQMEPSYGGSIDTAAELRGHCAMGLVRSGYPLVMLQLARLLADSEVQARLAAARAIAYAGRDSGVPLLQFKILTGDSEPQVMGACFSALLELAPELSLDLVAGFVGDLDLPVAEAAALALGESRLAEAFDILESSLETAISGDVKRTILLSIAMLRNDRAIEFLLNQIVDQPLAEAVDAIAALRMFRHDENLKNRVRDLARARGDIALRRAVEAHLP
jgi:HEAT repeat protein